MRINSNRFLVCLVLFTLGFQACNETSLDCSTVLCIGDSPIRLEIIENGSNLLASEAYSEADFSISGDVGSQVTIFLSRGLQGTTEALLEISDPSWDPGSGVFTLSIPGERQINFTAEFGETTGECCGGALTVDQVESQDVSITTNPGYFTLTLD